MITSHILQMEKRFIDGNHGVQDLTIGEHRSQGAKPGILTKDQVFSSLCGSLEGLQR